MTFDQVTNSNYLLRETYNKLIELAKKVERVDNPIQSSISIDLESLKDSTFSDPFPNIPTPSIPFIYVISCGSGLDSKTCYQLYAERREAMKGTFAFARINEFPSKTMYVGSSHSIKSRIKQHLGYGGKKTYSLQLSHWISSLSGSIVITIYSFEGIDKEVLQVVEDSLWSKLEPMFGKRGAR